jgi:hypothetical protein
MGYIVLQNLEVTVHEYIIQFHHQVVYFPCRVAYLGAQMNEFIYLFEISGEGEEPRQMFIVCSKLHPAVFCKFNTKECINIFWCEGHTYCAYWRVCVCACACVSLTHTHTHTVESIFPFIFPDETSLTRKYSLNKGHTIVCFKVNVYLVYKMFLKLYSALWDHWQISFIFL